MHQLQIEHLEFLLNKLKLFLLYCTQQLWSEVLVCMKCGWEDGWQLTRARTVGKARHHDTRGNTWLDECMQGGGRYKFLVRGVYLTQGFCATRIIGRRKWCVDRRRTIRRGPFFVTGVDEAANLSVLQAPWIYSKTQNVEVYKRRISKDWPINNR